MRCIARDLFLKPKVLLMLMVICLSSPLQTFQTIQSIQACPPDCSVEEAVVAAAEDDVATAMQAYNKALRDMLEALDDLEEKRGPYIEALKEVNRTALLLEAAILAFAAADAALVAASKKENHGR